MVLVDVLRGDDVINPRLRPVGRRRDGGGNEDESSTTSDDSSEDDNVMEHSGSCLFLGVPLLPFQF